MQFTTTQESPVSVDTDCLVIGLGENRKFGPAMAAVDEAGKGFLTRLLESGDLPTKSGKTVVLHSVPGVAAARVLIAGLGKDEKRDGVAFYNAVRSAGKALRQSRAVSAHCLLTEADVRDCDLTTRTRLAALALAHSDYIYSATKKPAADAPPATDRVSFPTADGVQAQLAVAECLHEGIQRCRDLGDLPPNLCNPKHLADTARDMARQHDGLKIEVLDEAQMTELKMNSLLAVGQGSTNPSYLIHLSWRGGPDEQAPLALVGKGITFDTGGISLKPRDLMEQMKFDMCGAATALGVMEAVARLKLPLNVDCIVAAVENMPDGNAYRPGDVITTMSGKTVEVHNTDAEGRMILADALTWTGQFVKPAAMVDIATLTGACVVALGHHASGIMTHDDELAEALLSAGARAADRGWRLPLWDDYQEQIDTPFADMKNIGGMPAGSVTAGCFLSRFTEGQKWAHLDIAGSAWQWGKPESATGRPVGMLVQWLVDQAGGWSAVGV
ncbi:MAG: leucyl aminopeptidase [Wenzhouxiangella sp.]|jgi:leucyl aminopeptidase|nr:leucyl aminopeptidase [Wenzhouxiangella sp.]